MSSRVFRLFLALTILCSCLQINTDGHKTRYVRQATPEYHVDILIVTDYSVYDAWYGWTDSGKDAQTRKNEALGNIKQYFTLLLKETTDYYQSLKTSFRLKFRPTGFYIEEREGQASLTPSDARGFVNASTAYAKLRQWLKDHDTTLPDSDHVLLFTRQNLDSDDQGFTAGWGAVGTVCKFPRQLSVSIVEDKGAFESVFTTMHELGHGFNASHDGTNNRCSSADGYVMSSGGYNLTAANQRNKWFFSSCSATEMENYVNSLSENAMDCLRSKLQQTDVPDITGVIPGQLYDADVQCQRLHGPTSYFSFQGNLSQVCTVLSCRDPADSRGLRYWIHTAATGTTCGNRQWCEEGLCVDSPKAPTVGSCYRDRGTTINGLSCEDMAQTQSTFCYDPDVYQSCCQSCNNTDSQIPGCPWGDRKGGCRTDICNRIQADGTIAAYDCCKTCNFNMSTWTCSDVQQVNGVSCSAALENAGYQRCYEGEFAFKCCATCQNLRFQYGDQGCEYGNRLLTGCPDPSTRNMSVPCDSANCCHSCKVKEVTDNSARDTRLCSMSLLVLVVSHVVLSVTGFVS